MSGEADYGQMWVKIVPNRTFGIFENIFLDHFDFHQMGQIWDFEHHISVHFGAPFVPFGENQNDLKKNIFKNPKCPIWYQSDPHLAIICLP